MLFKKILVPIDGSEPSKNALEMAKKLVGDDSEATLYIISVVPAGYIANELTHPTHRREHNPILMGSSSTYQALIDDTTAEAMSSLENLVGTTLDGAACNVEMQVLISGRIPDGIVDFAQSHNCDLIIMGRLGRGKLRGMLGGVSYSVLQSAHIPVLTIN